MSRRECSQKGGCRDEPEIAGSRQIAGIREAPGAGSFAQCESRTYGMLRAKRSVALAFDPKSLDELARRLAESVPPGIAALRDDLERNFKAVLQAGLSKLDLVTRQEFDIQAAVLRRSRERLEELEKRIAALEKSPKG